MAKRLSSIFSLGSNSSDTSTNDSRPRSTFISDRPSSQRPPSATLTSPRSTPDLRPTTPSSRPQSGPQLETARGLSPIDTSRLSPMMSPALNEPGGYFSPARQKPLPQQAGSPDIGRPGSRASGTGSRAPSRDGSAPNNRAASPAKFTPTTPTTEQSKLAKRRRWLSGSKGRPGSEDNGYMENTSGLDAWIITPRAHDVLRYDIAPLVRFQKVPELWNDACDTYIYLDDNKGERGPSFKIDSSLFASSRKLTSVAHGNVSSRPSNEKSGQNRLIHEDAQRLPLQESISTLKLDPPASPPISQQPSSTRSSSLGHPSHIGYFDEGNQRKREIHLGIPVELHANTADPNALLSARDIDILITVRNVFALLAGQPIIATSTCSSIFLIFTEIADFLQRYEFTNLDGSSLGEEVVAAFGHYVADFRIADVRSSPEKTIEAIILGERMKYWPLYNEGFVHAIGKYDSLVNLRSSYLRYISETAHKRMEMASIELSRRLRNVRGRLEDFDFASMWAGIANSKKSSDSKGIRFKAWRSAFSEMRTYVMSFYKERYGSWPPKARSKKNNFEESGLNRLLLRQLYSDFSDLYDALVDRTSLTTRHIEIPSSDVPEDDDQEPTSRALRRLLSEYDRSTPPVQPPIPFDTPRLPSLTSIRPDHLDLKRQKKEATRPLETSEINLALLKSYNREHGQDPMKPTPFIDAFTAFERRCARGKSIEELCDIRVGQWIFLYAVIQALPLVIIDAPGLKFTQGVEYFLCGVPKGSAPWVQENFQQRQSWYNVSGSSGMVSLPADVVEHGVDGIYRRSHCWIVAERWAGAIAIPAGDDGSAAASGQNYSRNSSISENPYQLQPGSPHIPFAEDLQPPVMPGSRPESRASLGSPNRDRRSSMALGLEQLPLPAGISPTGSRPTSIFNPDMSFDKILAAGVDTPVPGKKTKKK